MRLFALICALSCALTGCHRTSREVWEDTKTASRYVGKGMRSFLGKHTDPNNYAFTDNWEQTTGGGDYAPLADNDSYMAGAQGSSLSEFGQDGGGIPLSRESPGDPGSAIPGIDGFRDPSGELAALFRKIQFETDEYVVKGHENLETLQQIATYMTKHQGIFVFVEGHADERGAAAYNLALGSRRANSVRELLVQDGVSPDQLFTVSYGKERPVVTGHDEFTWKENRRAQFKLFEKN